MASYATIVAIDAATKSAKMLFRDIEDAAKLATFADALQVYCDADLRERNFVNEVTEVGTPVDAGPNSMCEFKAVIQYYDNTAAKYHTVEVPGPKATMFETVKGAGKRVTTVAGNAIVALLETATGGDLAFVKGWPIDNKTQSTI